MKKKNTGAKTPKTKKPAPSRTTAKPATNKTPRKTPSKKNNKANPRTPTPTKNTDINVRIKTHTDKNDGHPHVILDDIDHCHVSVGLSTQPKKGKGKKAGTNYPLQKSPLNDGKHSFMRRQGTVAPKGEYKNPQTGKMTQDDYDRAVIYGERAKQKYIEKKEQKKQRVPLPRRH